MGQLEVYDTRGNRLHPNKDETDPSIASYFERFVFGMTTEASLPQLEAYARMVLGESGREQVFIRYTGDDASSLVEDCREAVQTELLDERGWRLVEYDGPSDPRALFYTLMRDGGTPSGGQDALTDWFRSLVEKPEYADIAANWLESNDNTPIKVYARDYETLANVVPRFLDSSVHVFVGRSSSRERTTFQSTADDDIDIELLPDSRRTNRQNFSLHPDTRDQLEARWENQREDLRQRKYEKIRDTVGELSSLGTAADEVCRNVEQALQQEYPKLQVTRQQDTFGQGHGSEASPLDGGKSTEELATADEPSGLVDRLTTRKGIAVSMVVVLLMAAIGVSMYVGLFSGVLGGGDDGFEMSVTPYGNAIIVNGTAGNQMAGTYNVSVEKIDDDGNESELVRSGTLNLTNATSDSVTFKGMNPGKYKVTVAPVNGTNATTSETRTVEISAESSDGSATTTGTTAAITTTKPTTSTTTTTTTTTETTTATTTNSTTTTATTTATPTTATTTTTTTTSTTTTTTTNSTTTTTTNLTGSNWPIDRR